MAKAGAAQDLVAEPWRAFPEADVKLQLGEDACAANLRLQHEIVDLWTKLQQYNKEAAPATAV